MALRTAILTHLLLLLFSTGDSKKGESWFVIFSSIAASDNDELSGLLQPGNDQ